MPQGRRRHLALEIAFACFLQRGLALGLLHAREPLRRLDLLLLLHRPAPLPRMRAWPGLQGHGARAWRRRRLASIRASRSASTCRCSSCALTSLRACARGAGRAARVLRVVWYALQSYSPARDGFGPVGSAGAGCCRGRGIVVGLARRGAALLSSPSSRRSRPPARAPAARASPHAPDGADIRMRRCVGGDR